MSYLAHGLWDSLSDEHKRLYLNREHGCRIPEGATDIRISDPHYETVGKQRVFSPGQHRFGFSPTYYESERSIINTYKLVRCNLPDGRMYGDKVYL
jgi:hypothetical protein